MKSVNEKLVQNFVIIQQILIYSYENMYSIIVNGYEPTADIAKKESKAQFSEILLLYNFYKIWMQKICSVG